jgi:hypothetical protein
MEMETSGSDAIGFASGCFTPTECGSNLFSAGYG